MESFFGTCMVSFFNLPCWLGGERGRRRSGRRRARRRRRRRRRSCRRRRRLRRLDLDAAALSLLRALGLLPVVRPVLGGGGELDLAARQAVDAREEDVRRGPWDEKIFYLGIKAKGFLVATWLEASEALEAW